MREDPARAAADCGALVSFRGRGFSMDVVVYADESGTHSKSGELKGSAESIVGGLTASAEEWAEFSREWQLVLNKYGAPFFHFR